MTNRQFTSLLFSYVLGFVYLSAGLSKLGRHTFGNVIGPVEMDKILEIAGIPVFFGHFISFFQIITGAMLLTRLFRIPGAVLAFPLSVGLFIFTINWGATAVINAGFLLLSIALLYFEWGDVKMLLQRNFSMLTGRKWKDGLLRINPSLAVILLSLLAFLTGTILPQNSVLFILITSLLMLAILYEISLNRNTLLIDKIILICYGIFIGIIAYMPLFVGQGNLIREVFFPILVVLVLVGFILFVVRLIWKWNKG